MLMLDTYAMGWMDETTKAAWTEAHDVKNNLMSSTAHIKDLDSMTMSYGDNAAANASLNAAENFKKAAVIHTEAINTGLFEKKYLNSFSTLNNNSSAATIIIVGEKCFSIFFFHIR